MNATPRRHELAKALSGRASHGLGTLEEHIDAVADPPQRRDVEHHGLGPLDHEVEIAVRIVLGRQRSKQERGA